MDESWITPLTKWAERTGGNFFIEIAGFASGNTLDASIELWENDRLVNRRGGFINSDTTIELLVSSLLLEQDERDKT